MGNVCTMSTMLNMNGWIVVALMEKSNRVSAMIRSDAVACRDTNAMIFDIISLRSHREIH